MSYLPHSAMGARSTCTRNPAYFSASFGADYRQADISKISSCVLHLEDVSMRISRHKGLFISISSISHVM